MDHLKTTQSILETTAFIAAWVLLRWLTIVLEMTITEKNNWQMNVFSAQFVWTAAYH